MEKICGGLGVWSFLLCSALFGGCGDARAPGDAQSKATEDISRNSYEACSQHLECDDGNECTKDLCTISQRCEYVVEVAKACNDGDPCTQGSLCLEDGACGGPTVGPMPAPPCFQCTCDAVDGMLCEPRVVGSDCVDQDPCTIHETCSEENECWGADPCDHGECQPKGEKFGCACDVGWSGDRCEIPAD